MKIPVFVFLLLITPAFAQAPEKPACVDATRDHGYNARPISRHEVLARNAIGSEKRSVRLATTCIHIDSAAIVALRSFSRCVARGDEVAVSVMGGPRESCKVSGVMPGEDYATAKYGD